MKKTIIALALACLGMLCTGPVWADESTNQPHLRAAIFIQNRAGQEMQGQIGALNDHLTAELTEKGFSVIDKDVVIARFRESRDSVDTARRDLKALEEVIKLGKSESSIEDAVTGASALRIAQMLGADYLVVATITSLSRETRTFKGRNTVYGTDNQATVFNLNIALKVLDGNQGGTVYGDVMTASERVVVGENLTIATTGIIPKLVESGARKIAGNIADKVERIRSVQVKTAPVAEFTVTSNVEGATVELDGAVLGSTPGRFTAAPGLHHLRLSKEWLATWDRTVNVYPNQVLNITLELSEEGLRRYANIEQLKNDLARARMDVEMGMKEREAGIGIAKEQSEADAYAKKNIAEGEKKKREESYERIEGPPTTNFYK